MKRSRKEGGNLSGAGGDANAHIHTYKCILKLRGEVEQQS